MTRLEALDKAAEMLKNAENSVGDAHLSKHVTLAQLYMTLAHEIYEDTHRSNRWPHDPAA